jgi:hypothetical protein
MSRSLRIRSRSARFLGALLGLLLFMLLVFLLESESADPTSNAGLWLFLVGAVVMMGLGAWLLPWIPQRFSARYARRRGLK